MSKKIRVIVLIGVFVLVCVSAVLIINKINSNKNDVIKTEVFENNDNKSDNIKYEDTIGVDKP